MQDSKFCTLYSYHSIEELLTKELSFSKSIVKRLLSKNFLKRGVNKGDELSLPLDLLNYQWVNPSYEGEPMMVIKEDDNFIAINKQHGIHGHPLNYSERNTVVNFLRNQFCLSAFLDESKRGESNLLYRIDRETSGLMIFAKKNSIYESIRQNFNHMVKEKVYLAVVEGEFNQEGVHSHYLESFGKKGAQMRAASSGEERVSIKTSLVEYNEQRGLSLIRIELGQGVRHQIRCQLSEIGFPIVGDTLYGGCESRRLFLHAYEYRIEVDDIQFSAKAEVTDLFLTLFNLNSGL
ncbi:hypothetical protein BIY24_12715 [Halobacteriovorax marinus]|uniref:RluA family pseudouridine synthase n=1 Tax=Halobacteriovorax marinus TaxID=97084 RepID=UPI000BC309E2|nr:RluA family pseudouridine synthase [Halobacteriovorax marinus]ATH08778.1 hypothetical protein BIY24_12715 [Halobacteriovorax marinus]